MDAIAFLEHMEESGQSAYPFGLTLPPASPAQESAINQEVQALIEFNDGGRDEQTVSLDAARVQAIIADLTDLRTNVVADYISDLAALIATDDVDNIVSELDALIDGVRAIFTQTAVSVWRKVVLVLRTNGSNRRIARCGQ